MIMKTLILSKVVMRSAAYSLLFVCAVAAISITAVPSAMAASGPVALDSVPQAKLSDKAAMQNGAKTFMSYCLGCHGVSAMRYSRLSDIGMNEEQIKALLPEGKKTGDYIRTSISRNDAKEWFGAAPPDLSLTARARSSHSGFGVALVIHNNLSDRMAPRRGWIIQVSALSVLVGSVLDSQDFDG